MPARFADLQGWFESTFAPVVTNSDTYLSVGMFIYHGSDDEGAPTHCCVLAGVTDADACGVRLYDHTNAQVIAERLDITDPFPSIVDLGALSNVPTGAAVWEVQVRRVTGNGTKKVGASSISLRF